MDRRFCKCSRIYNVICIFLMSVIFGSTALYSQTTEKFADPPDGSTTFSEGGLTFSTTGKLAVDYREGWGYDDDYFISNFGNAQTGGGTVGSFTNSSGYFHVHGLYIIPLNASELVQQYNDILIRGKLGGSEQFTHTVYWNTFNTGPTNNYYTIVDLSGYSSYTLDELEFIIDPYGTNNIVYLMIDNFQFSSAAPPNTPPTASSFSTSSGPYQNAGYTFSTSDFGYSDTNSDPIDHVRITAVPGYGTLYVDADNGDDYDSGEELSNGSTVSKANLDAGNLQYYTSTYSGSTSFTFDVNDGTDYSASTYTATLNVAGVPSATTGAATGAGQTTATLNGTINANNASTTVTFEYGSDTDYGTTVTADESPVTGTVSTGVSYWLTGLNPGSTYHFRVKGTNAAGTSYGDDQEFTTEAGAPACTTGTAANETMTTADLGGDVTDDGGAAVTERGVVYSSTVYPPEIGTPGVTKEPNGSGTGAFSETITGLASGTRYWFRAYAINSVDTAYGEAKACTTLVEITFTNGADASLNFEQANAMPSDTDWLCGQFSLDKAASGYGYLTSVTATLGGTYDAGDLQSTPFQLYRSTSNSFGSASAVGSSQADPGSGGDVTFSGFVQYLSSGMNYFWITADISASATADDNLNATIDAANDLSFMSGTLSASSSYGKLNAGTDASLPVDLASFSVRQEGAAVVLEWMTGSETDNLGYLLERAADPSSPQWRTIASYQTHDALKGRGNTSSRTEYAFTDPDVTPGETYAYRLSDVSTDGEITVYASLSITLDALPAKTEMEKAYPNPFNPSTFISYHLAEDCPVDIAVFDMLGRKIQTLYSGPQPAGSYHVYWHGKAADGHTVPTGAYLIRMQAENAVQVQKVMLMK